MRLDDVCQVYPSRLTVVPARAKTSTQSMVSNYAKSLQRNKAKATYLENFKIKKQSFELSKSSKRKIFDSINTMYCLSKPRTIKMQNGKSLYNFRLSFITLTLPSKQQHSDTEIKKHCLNQFLFEIKRKYKISNFVWKAELQANENIHFHIITDAYIDYQSLRRRWNRIINKLGYVSEYSNKFRALNLSQYHEIRNRKAVSSFEKSKTAFAVGKRSNWQNPNSVDVKSVKSKKELAIYLGKYITKSVSKNKLSELDQERLTSFGRSWSRSYSLAQLKFVHKYLVSEIQQVLKYLESKPQLVKKVVGDFFTAYYFNVQELSFNFKKFHNKYMQALASIYNYPIPAG